MKILICLIISTALLSSAEAGPKKKDRTSRKTKPAPAEKQDPALTKWQSAFTCFDALSAAECDSRDDDYPNCYDGVAECIAKRKSDPHMPKVGDEKTEISGEDYITTKYEQADVDAAILQEVELSNANDRCDEAAPKGKPAMGGYWRVPSSAGRIYVRPNLTGLNATDPLIDVVTPNGVYQVPAPKIDPTKMKGGGTYSIPIFVLDPKNPGDAKTKNSVANFVLQFRVTEEFVEGDATKVGGKVLSFDPGSISVMPLNTTIATSEKPFMRKARSVDKDPARLNELFPKTAEGMKATFDEKHAQALQLIEDKKKEVAGEKDPTKKAKLKGDLKWMRSTLADNLYWYYRSLSIDSKKDDKSSACNGIDPGVDVGAVSKSLTDSYKAKLKQIDPTYVPAFEDTAGAIQYSPGDSDKKKANPVK